MGGQNKERKSRGGHGLFDWDKIRDDRWKGVYLGSSVHGISSRYTKVKDLEWYKKVDGKELVVDSNEEMDEIKRKEEEAFAQALGYSVAPTTKKSVPKVSTEELKQVITATNSNYNDEQGGIGYSAAALKDFKDSIKDHLQVPSDNGRKPMYNSSQSISETKKDKLRDDEHLKRSRRDDRRRSRSPVETYSRKDRRRSRSPVETRRRSPSPMESRSNRRRSRSPVETRRRSPSPMESRSNRRRSRSPVETHSRKDRRRSRSPVETRRRSLSPMESRSRRDDRRRSRSPKGHRDRTYSRRD